MTRRIRTPMQRAVATAEGQRGLLLLQQAVAAGLTDDQVEHLTATAGWQRLVRRLYALPGSTPCWQRDAVAACLLAGDDGLATHLTAAAAWTWCSPPLLPHVSVPVGHSTRTPLAAVHRVRHPIAAIDRATRDGIRCTSASRTLVDCAAIVERGRLEQFVDDALCSGVASVGSIRAAQDRAGRRGRAGGGALDAVLDVWADEIRPGSPAEVRLLRRLESLGAAPVSQYEVYDAAGVFVARLDAAIPDRRHGFEYDSDRFHNPRHWARDEPRYERLRALGWRIDAVSKHDLLPSSTRLADLLVAPRAA